MVFQSLDESSRVKPKLWEKILNMLELESWSHSFSLALITTVSEYWAMRTLTNLVLFLVHNYESSTREMSNEFPGNGKFIEVVRLQKHHVFRSLRLGDEESFVMEDSEIANKAIVWC